MKTLFMLMAVYETSEIPLRDICEEYLHMDYKTAAYRANKQRLPFPVYRAGSQKSGWLVSADVLAKYLDEQKQEAEREWKKMNVA